MAAPRDNYERYLVEKIWEWIPEVYRSEDGAAIHPDVLRSLIEVLGPSLAASRRSVDRLWEDQFAEFADDWALPYIGNLVGTRLVSALNRRGRRADVARTVFYRRRKGTVTVLALLARDIAGWDSFVVESFRRLGRTPHRLDPPLAGSGAVHIGRVTHTPPGGFADLRRTRGGDLVDGPFDEYSHTTDVRQLRGFKGRYNIPKLNIHLFRRQAFPIRFATPVDLGASRYTLDPSGRDIDLFRPSHHDSDECIHPVEWQIVAPLPCRLLGEARYLPELADIPAPVQPKLASIVGLVFENEARLKAMVRTLLTPAEFTASISAILAASITVDSPKFNLLPDPRPPGGGSLVSGAVAVGFGADQTEPRVGRERVLPANLVDWGSTLTADPDRVLALDPQRGRLLLTQALAGGAQLFIPLHHTGLFGDLGASTYSRRDTVVTTGVTNLPDGGIANPGPVTGFLIPATGVQQFTTSKTYQPDSPVGGVVDNVEQLMLQAADPERPYIRLTPELNGTRWTFRAKPKPPGNPALRTLIIDGLWIGMRPGNLAQQIVAGSDVPATPVATVVALEGVFDQVIVRNCTLDPGGERARTIPTAVLPIPVVQLETDGQLQKLIIERSIVGPLRELVTTVDPCSGAEIIIRESVVQSIDPAVPAIETRIASLDIQRSTVFGDIVVNRIEASETLVQGKVTVTDNQHGCFRFSAADTGSSLPRQFRSHLLAPRVPNHIFESRRFGDSPYAELSDTAPDIIRRGSENRSEIGVWSAILAPIKQDDLTAKTLEFMPFGLIPQFINET